jgi:hypothetical protein
MRMAYWAMDWSNIVLQPEIPEMHLRGWTARQHARVQKARADVRSSLSGGACRVKSIRAAMDNECAPEKVIGSVRKA